MMKPELKLTKRVTANERERDLCCQLLWPRNLQRLSVGDSTFCLRILKHTDTGEVVRDASCLHRRKKRENRVEKNSKSESERLSRESWREKSGGKHAMTESLRESETEK